MKAVLAKDAVNGRTVASAQIVAVVMAVVGVAVAVVKAAAKS